MNESEIKQMNELENMRLDRQRRKLSASRRNAAKRKRGQPKQRRQPKRVRLMTPRMIDLRNRRAQIERIKKREGGLARFVVVVWFLHPIGFVFGATHRITMFKMFRSGVTRPNEPCCTGAFTVLCQLTKKVVNCRVYYCVRTPVDA